MDADERDICLYLKSWPGQFVSAREISRRAGGKRRFQVEPNWASAALSRLQERALVESDSTGHYRLRRRERTRPQGKWISPQMKQILQKSGRDFGQVVELETPDDFYADAELQLTLGE